MKDGFPLESETADRRDTPSTSGLRRVSNPAIVSRRPDPAASLQGRIVNGRYLIEERVGEGGMAYVYRAHDKELDRTVAFKVLISRLLDDPESVARLRREAQLALKLTHPNVCGLLAYGEAAGVPFLVMPYLEGETLSRREDRIGTMPPKDAVPILIQLCHGLQHAHEQGILHRDLKPENVMLVVDPPGERAVVMDFGLAKEHIMGPELNRLTATGIVLGTPEFMSPEQIRGKSIDGRSDVFALGVVGFEMLTTELPFSGSTAQETMLNHLTGTPRSLRSVLPSLSAELDQVIDKAIRVDLTERYGSMAEFATALSRLR
jgi:serine/threonine-protein kinase